MIVREDRGIDPTTLVAEALRMGRAPNNELVLNHPTVSRLHAGIKEIGGRFYLFNLSSTNSTTLNGKLVPMELPQALAGGDEIRVGPFFLAVSRRDDALVITVTLQFGLRIGDVESRGDMPAAEPVARAAAPAPAATEVAQALDLFWGKRSREKAARRSPLHPLTPPRLGKARFNWVPTRDLVRPWPLALFFWATIVIGILSIAAALGYTSAYVPDRISKVHSLKSMTLTPPIAEKANAKACTTCHALTGSMEARCASCHTTDAFVGTVTKVHADAGIGCVDCHTEHRGKDSRPLQLGLNSCTRCHTDKNTKTYNGKAVGTPHGGTLGYPKVNGQWKWKGLDPEELAARPKIAAMRTATNNEQVWRNVQFHALHILRVKATGGVAGVATMGAGSPQLLSCSSCHNSWVGANVDRDTPRKTCGECHNGLVDSSGTTLIAAGSPNCISCHVQHVRDKRHWNPDLLTPDTPPPVQQ